MAKGFDLRPIDTHSTRESVTRSSEPYAPPAKLHRDPIGERRARVLCGVLVAIHFSIAGQYYFGTLVGLTDDTGVARITREKIEQDFSENQRFFLMDCRVPLSKCDPIAVMHIEGGAGFIERRSDVDSPSTAATARKLWLAATNENVQPERTSVDLRKADRNGVVRTRLRIRKRSV